jgi:hypothetical protein
MFKAVTRAIAQSIDPPMMAGHLAQLLVGALELKGSAIFILNPDDDELEVLGSFGLSIEYMNKGPLLYAKSIRSTFEGKPVIIRDIESSDLLQYPEAARKEGIGAIVSLPIGHYGNTIGALRLYSETVWDITDKDVDSLLLLGEIIGLAMTYARLASAVQTVKDTVEEIHPIWLKTGK